MTDVALLYDDVNTADTCGTSSWKAAPRCGPPFPPRFERSEVWRVWCSGAHWALL